MKWTDAGLYRGPTRIENGVLVRDQRSHGFADDDTAEPRVEVRDDGSTHVYLGSAKVRDEAIRTADAPATVMTEIADPRRAASGMQPDESGFKTIDFRRGRDGRWTGNAGGRRYRLRVSHDNSTYRVEEDRDGPPWSVRMRQGDKALASPERALSDEQHQAGLSRWQGLLDSFWRRKDSGEAA